LVKPADSRKEVKEPKDGHYKETLVCLSIRFRRRTGVSIVLGEDGAERPVDTTEDHRVGQGLDKLARTGREGEEKSGGEEDEKEDGDEDVRIKGSHFF
jgi:hypothetical protein